ncbi:MAG: IS66 family insertion sequence element accessory protein TnpB [Solirubrobacteraceae bacterium]
MLPPSVRIFVCTQPQDMRRSFDRLAQVAREVVGEDPQGGAMFVFAGKRGTRLKVLWWDRNGLCLLYKRLHGAVFELPSASVADGPRASVRIDAAALGRLLAGVAKAERGKK